VILRARVRVHVLAALLVAAGSTAIQARADGRVGRGPAPAWVDRTEPDLSRQPSREGSGGLELLLYDQQIRVGAVAGGLERHVRVARRILSAEGVQNGSEVEIPFEPSYERLTVHAVSLIRQGKRMDALAVSRFKVIQQESERDRRLYDGSLSALVFLRDVREGDVVEYAYTISGQNPILGGRYSDELTLEFTVPVGRLRFRLLVPEGRTVQIRPHRTSLAPVARTVDGWQEWSWDRADVAALQIDSDVPSWYRPRASVEVSEYASWAEVARWAASVFPLPELSAGMKRELERWRRLPSEEARFLAALRFVQDEVRYLGMEMGPNSHRPFAPAVVYARRFGDCKDKSLLLATFLAAMGIEARVALVSTTEKERVEERLASPFAFDHAIVVATVGGKRRWVDPTRSLERGDLALLAPPPFRRGLLVDPATEAFEPIPEPAAPEPLVDVQELYSVRRFGADVAFDVETRFAGPRAMSMRRTVASTSLTELSRRFLNYYARYEPRIRTAGTLEVQDDGPQNVLVVREHYLLPPFDEGATHEFYASAVSSALVDTDTPMRTAPLDLGPPSHVRHVIRIDLPGRPRAQPWEEEVKGPGFRLEAHARTEPRALVLEYVYRSTAGSVEPSAIAAHLDAVRKARGILSYELPLGVALRAPAQDELPLGLWIAGIVLGISFPVLVIFWWAGGSVRGSWQAMRQRRRQRAFRAKFRTRRGDAADNPIAVRSVAEMSDHAIRSRCACGALMLATGCSGEDRVLFGGQELAVVRLSCPRCSAARALYFTLLS